MEKLRNNISVPITYKFRQEQKYFVAVVQMSSANEGQGSNIM